MPLSSLSNDAPVYDRKWKKNIVPKENKFYKKISRSFKIYESLKKILMSPNSSEKSWVWEQYDQTVHGRYYSKTWAEILL